jgi:hypothetical protein
MHRSGTTMLCSMLEQLGLFVGEEKDNNNESFFFLRINDWLLKQSGASWDYPGNFSVMLKEQRVLEVGRSYIDSMLRTKFLVSYLGTSNFKRYGSLDKLPFVWGWKDPRNTFTLPFWLGLFPEAKIIHVYRNGIDVAKSLQARELKLLSRAESKAAEGKLVTKYRWSDKILSVHNMKMICGSLRCLSLEGGFSLWEEHMREAQRHVTALGERSMEVCYEDFLENPSAGLRTLAAFCGLSAAGERIDAVAGSIVASRKNAFLKDPELRLFHQQVKERLEHFGYGDQ